MDIRISSALVGSLAVLTVNSVAATAVASAAPELGSLPARVIRNQLQYCGVICPFVVQGAVTVPVAVTTAPITFTGAALSSGSLLQAAGAAAASVTSPALAATDPIITNDLTLVLPKAQNVLQVSVVELINVGFASGDPGEFVRSIDGARTRIANALDQRVGDPVGPTGATNLPQVVAVEAINVGSAVAFQATERALLDVVATADDTAQTLARTGNVAAATSVGARDTVDAVVAARRTVTDSVTAGATHVRASLHDPFPTSAGRSAHDQATNTGRAGSHRFVDKVVHRATTAVRARHSDG